ncbi:myeloid differentiation primary response protein MyD88 [Drosophila rhopaloa]|uniref:Myeloid differentiation primary response protein MyD88 n=1 Tax=Drosophila rhopaloa TaxID=1041015 RepID=A0ABM5I497_DRORH|nr:myeloid differentiation primary response protein MyD88 [Drosophila rhopaloa]
MRPRFVCHQQHSVAHSYFHPHSHTHSHYHRHPNPHPHPPNHSHHIYGPTDVSYRRYRTANMVVAEGVMDSGSGIGEGMGHFNETPLSELGIETRTQLSRMLNRKKVLHSEEGYQRDWRGISQLAKQKGFVDDNANNPMDLLLISWSQRSPKTAVVGNLEKYLGIIDRWDVCDDIQENLAKDTQRYIMKQEQRQTSLIKACPSPPSDGLETNNNYSDNITMGQSVQILSEEDQRCVEMGQPLPRYHACVLYAEADIDHATEIINILESERYNLRLFLRNRMLLGVPFEHVQLSHFLATRCNKLIVVLTDDFLRCPENAFFVNFTQKLQIEDQSRRIIPILYKPDMHIPLTLGIYTHIKYTGDSKLFNFWDKLAYSLHDMDTSHTHSTPQAQTPSPVEESAPKRVTTPSIRIQINDKDVTDMPSYNSDKVPEAETTMLTISGDTSSPLPEHKPKNSFLRKITHSFGKTPRNEGASAKSLRHAHSVSTINVTARERTLSASSSNISTTSESKKSSIKWQPNILKKVLFSRSSSKLQTPG